MKKVKFTLCTIILLITFQSCGTIKEGFKSPKKNSTDEFLVEKKSPLVMPPEFESLPKPIDNEADDEEEVFVDDEEIDISKILKNKSDTKKTEKNNSSKSLENSISDILKDK